MFRKRKIATVDLLAALPGHPFSQVEREVRLAMDRYVATRVRLQSFGFFSRLTRSSLWLEVHAQLGQDLLNLRSVIARSDKHREAFRAVVAGLHEQVPYRKVFAQLDD